jgi:hypothetical protein
MKEDDEKIWRKFLSKHFGMFIAFIAIVILAAIGAVFVLLWFVGEAQITGVVPTTLGFWTMSHLISFLLHLLFWEVILIGIPIIIVVLAFYFLWWKKLPDEERQEYTRRGLFGKRSKRTDGGSAISFLINIFFIIKVYIDGKWDMAFAEWDFDYLVYSYLWALLWVLVILGIPAALGLIWWIKHK